MKPSLSFSEQMRQRYGASWEPRQRARRHRQRVRPLMHIGLCLLAFGLIACLARAFAAFVGGL